MHRAKDGPGAVRLFLTGAIDERADVAALFTDLAPEVIVDLAGVDRINSIGIKRWVPVLTTVTATHRVFVEAISYPVALQAGFTANLFGRAEIRSCNAPYYCTGCRSSQTVLVTREESLGAPGGIPEKSCPTCRMKMSFDDIEAYFAFFTAGPA